MKRFLLACATVGLAAGAGYYFYQIWKRYSEENKEESGSNEAVSKKNQRLNTFHTSHFSM